jgi:Icc-related predicted phosphoesterase
MMRIVAFGDIHMKFDTIKQIPGLAEADCVVITGDFTNYGGAAEAQIVLEAIRRINPRIHALPGNLDKPSVATCLDELGINLHGQGVTYGELGLFGVGGSNPTPFNTPTEYTEEEIARLARKGYEQVAGVEILVLVSHAPPFDTVTDKIASGIHAGSRSIREFIETYQPNFCLTGHIHEARGEDRIGQTRVLNPGMLRAPGWVHLVCGTDGKWTATLEP